MKKIIVVLLTLTLVFSCYTSVSFGASAAKAKQIKITYPAAKEYSLNTGSKVKFKIKISPKNTKKNVKWSSSAKSVATVSKDGVVTGKKTGKAKITVKLSGNSKVKASKTVKVIAPVKSVSISGKAVVGNKLTAKVSPAGSKVKYTWYHVKDGNRMAIEGAKSSTYLLSPADQDQLLQVGVTGTGYNKGTKYSKVISVLSETDAFRAKVDDQYGIQVIKTLTSKQTHPELGFRMSGSDAEKEIADYIYQEYKKMGLKNVTMDPIKADGWEFKKGTLTYQDGGSAKTLPLASYQTTFVTNGKYELVYAGRGYKDDYQKLKKEGIDLKDKIVLIDTDQYNEYWINIPAYEAHAQGAAAVIACEKPREAPSYGMLSDDQIQLNDICGPDDAPALSVSRNGSKALIDQIEKNGQGIDIKLNVSAKVTKNKGSQNVWAEIPGKSKETIIVMSHYDSYFKAALDDADGTAVNMAMAKAMAESGYVPDKTIRFVHHGAEEWGLSGSIYDWAIGAYRQIKEVHPEWADNGFAAINVDSFTIENRGLESDNRDMYKKIRINAPQLDEFARTVIDKNLPKGYSIGRYDTVANNFFEDFSYMTSGIPKILFTRTDYQSQFDTYHSSADNFEYYSQVAKQDTIIGDKSKIVAAAVMAFDDQLIQPVNYESYFEGLKSSISADMGGSAADSTLKSINEVKSYAAKLDQSIAEHNETYGKAVKANDKAKIAALEKEAPEQNKELFAMYKKFQKSFTRLDHAGDVVAPHEAYQNNVFALEKAVSALEEKDIETAIENLRSVDSNDLATDFSRKTYNQTVAQKTGSIGTEKMAWGTDMIDKPNQNLYKVITNLVEKEGEKTPSLEYEKEAVKDALYEQQEYLEEMLKKEEKSCRDMKGCINGLLTKL